MQQTLVPIAVHHKRLVDSNKMKANVEHYEINESM
jgi:hypothetical protein